MTTLDKIVLVTVVLVFTALYIASIYNYNLFI